ncbi:tRNA (guanine-N1)-methyltransferase [Subsaximicrobium wynnwilliamsii]|uniref:tRNA (Guanine-N1)-methyltransferase n=1 Tax=Subsaximicrobium wynnwilliamsii TaxID=291179 RepID=A0A5C6ZFD1_9FLAO|nr:tRNA (guanine-N1)-methyltransferase [Subsaximicrobium wynnwilliamsii]TXD83024.1 tRNA (guanine-N1)-methyltransferase [Subsaximicrobium wynnwilliamsii]TXD88768.1 tRNA (guanine-N1)-methyltransferase [Subsaximicrobium wynnwilliamsii]TXE02841.1 tRNA (guanine-N1)-methyltransferase [Subsaximicrobium wynnwilliamsii]
MNFFKTLSLTILCSFCLLNSNAQDDDKDKLSLNEGTIDNQFEYLIQRSNDYQDYKVVKKTWLYTLKEHTMDSLNAVRNDLTDTKQVVERQTKEISDLKKNLNSTETDLDNTIAEKDNMALFGIPMSKGNYSMLMWIIIAVLIVLLLFFIYRFKNSNTVTKQAQLSLSETEDEFEEHRRIALEREQKVRRQLQDELNKHKNN